MVLHIVYMNTLKYSIHVKWRTDVNVAYPIIQSCLKNIFLNPAHNCKFRHTIANFGVVWLTSRENASFSMIDFYENSHSTFQLRPLNFVSTFNTSCWPGWSCIHFGQEQVYCISDHIVCVNLYGFHNIIFYKDIHVEPFKVINYMYKTYLRNIIL